MKINITIEMTRSEINATAVAHIRKTNSLPAMAEVTLKEVYGYVPTPVDIPNEIKNLMTLAKNGGQNKIAMIKSVRTLSGLGLKEAKDLVELVFVPEVPLWARTRSPAGYDDDIAGVPAK